MAEGQQDEPNVLIELLYLAWDIFLRPFVKLGLNFAGATLGIAAFCMALFLLAWGLHLDPHANRQTVSQGLDGRTQDRIIDGARNADYTQQMREQSNGNWP